MIVQKESSAGVVPKACCIIRKCCFKTPPAAASHWLDFCEAMYLVECHIRGQSQGWQFAPCHRWQSGSHVPANEHEFDISAGEVLHGVNCTTLRSIQKSWDAIEKENSGPLGGSQQHDEACFWLMTDGTVLHTNGLNSMPLVWSTVLSVMSQKRAFHVAGCHDEAGCGSPGACRPPFAHRLFAATGSGCDEGIGGTIGLR